MGSRKRERNYRPIEKGSRRKFSVLSKGKTVAVPVIPVPLPHKVSVSGPRDDRLAAQRGSSRGPETIVSRPRDADNLRDGNGNDGGTFRWEGKKDELLPHFLTSKAQHIAFAPYRRPLASRKTQGKGIFSALCGSLCQKFVILQRLAHCA